MTATSPTYLNGPEVLGFWGMFENSFGDSSTPLPLSRITPSRVGSALLPFHCPRCKEVIDFSDPEQREHFHDARVDEARGKKRNNYWCPSCGYRFRLNLRGKSTEGAVVLGYGDVATSIVERVTMGADGLVNASQIVQRAKKALGLFSRRYLLGSDVLGAD